MLSKEGREAGGIDEEGADGAGLTGHNREVGLL